MSSTVPNLKPIAHNYDGILCDVWGVMHNGIELYPDILNSFAKFKQSGGAICLITNAPRPSAPVVEALKAFGVPRSAYDDIVSSGDVTVELIKRQNTSKVHHMGPEKDLSLFEGLELDLVSLDKAELIVCSDLYEEYGQDLSVYEKLFTPAIKKNVPMICANPDLFIDHGGQKIWCSGKVAQIYDQMNGEVMMVGKPYAPIYNIGLEKLSLALGKKIDKDRVLAIGDSIKTDLTGAHQQQIDMYFVAGGIHALDDELGQDGVGIKLRETIAPFNDCIKALAPRLTW